MKEDLLEKRKQEIRKDLLDFYAHKEFYISFRDIFFDKEFYEKVDPRERNILIFTHNSLLSHLYLSLRHLLSSHERDASFFNLYREVRSPSKLKNDEIRRMILPNSYTYWIQLKEYINKNFSHKDKDRYEISIDFDNEVGIEEIIKDIKENFCIISKESFSFDSKDAKKLADRLFKGMAQSYLKSPERKS